ncbi:short-chain dehydrogenase [Annulohypoxylon bovei var. microspora]|nr:short-chain dehydrogenase [Annulohypoxylon bovei var. microspora]
MGAQWSQVFPPKPTFTEASLESQEGRVFLITGGYSGIGFELAKMLYRYDGRVYIAGRSEEKARQAIKAIQAEAPTSKGSLEFLHLELDDLSTIKASAEAFKARESKLHVLWNNAGVSRPPLGSVSKQGIELQLATNCLGPFLFTQLLMPLVKTTAATAPPSSVRVIWTASNIVELSAPTGALVMSELDNPPQDQSRVYTNSKAGNWLLSAELARQAGPSGVVSVALNPGTAYTNLFRHTPSVWFFAYPLMCNPKEAAYTELYAGLSKDISLENNGCYVVPFGRLAKEKDQRDDLLNAFKAKEDGGSGRAKEFWDYCADKTRDYS